MVKMPDPMGTVRVEHVTASNAQVALQAAATAFQGRTYATDAQSVLKLAEQFKAWLDAPGAVGREAAKSGRY